MRHPIANKKRLESTAAFLARELRKLLKRYDPNAPGSLIRACPTYKDGLTYCEGLLATQRALSLLQLEKTQEIAKLVTYSDSEDEADC
jgi:hypothetical protein